MRTIVTHDNCPDGLASAMILKLAYPEAKIVFVQHGTPEFLSLPAEPGMIFCDISPPKDRAADFVAAGAVVLDHHKTAREVVAMFGPLGRFADEVTEPGVSGALLAWEHGIEEDPTFAPIRDFARIVGTRDTWQKSSPDFERACDLSAALMFWPRETWLNATPAAWNTFAAIGPVLRSKHLSEVKDAIGKAMRAEVAGRRVIVFPGLTLSSDAAEMIGGAADIVVGFGFVWEENEGRVVYSLRSHAGYDVSALAKAFGGGGHTAAAGFKVASVECPYMQFRGLLAAYEAGRSQVELLP